MGNIILQYREVDASIHNFDTLMKKPIERRPENPDEIGPLERIRFENVVFRHRTASFNAVDGISFDVRSGETIAIVGPSGSGKSTLVKLLVGLYSPVSGSIFFNRASSTNIRYNPLRRQIGFVTQESQLYAGSIKENMQFVRSDATDEEILDALRKAQATPFLSRAAEGIDSDTGKLAEIFYLEFIARVTSHIPDKGQVMVRYYGLYAAVRPRLRAGRPDDYILSTWL